VTDVWYYAEGNKPVGPYGLQALVAALANRPDADNTLVWSKSLGDWHRLTEVEELRVHFTPPPISPPPTPWSVPRVSAPSPKPTVQASSTVQETGAAAEVSESKWSVKKFTLGAIGLVATLIAAAVGGVLGKAGVQAVMSPSKASIQSQLEAAHEKMLPQLRADLPKRVDDQTTMVAVDARGGTVFYSYRVDVNRSDLNFGEFAGELKKSITSAACKEQAYAKSLGYGAKYQYAYSDKNGQALGTILVQRGDC
jgi:hypothetical protein